MLTPQTLLDYAAGLHEGIRSEVYHQKRLALVSSGALTEVLRSPAHYRAWLDAPEEEPTPALAFGQAFHCALLEPAVFYADYAVQPDFGNCSHKEPKAKRDAWRTENAGRIFLSTDDSVAIAGMIRSIQAHPVAGPALTGGVAELTALWTDAESGLKCRARADYYTERHRLIVDAKSCADASPDGFRKSVFNYGYHRQDALYRQGFAACGAPIDWFLFVAVEKEPPYAVGVYQLDVDGLARGAAKVRQAIDTLAVCHRTGLWPGYSSHIETITSPPWAA